MKYKNLLSSLLLLTFLLGVHNGRIALWKEPDPEPVKVFPYPVSALPDDVRQALENGIRIETQEDLDQLLENFCS